jgi:hypothetical protein
MSARRVRTIGWMVAALATLAGVVAWIVPPALDVEPLAPVITPMRATETSVLDASVAEGIVLSNAFAAARTAPATRYTPVEQMTDTAAGATLPDPTGMASLPMMPGSAGDAPAMDGPRLFGTLVSPDGPKALLQLGEAGPALYGVGDREGGWQVVSIAPRQVVLRGRSRRITFRLEPEEERP